MLIAPELPPTRRPVAATLGEEGWLHLWRRVPQRRPREAVAVELRQATTSLGITEVTERPLRVRPKLVRQTIDEMTGILEHAPLDTRVVWVRDLFERIDVDSRESHAVAV